MFILGYLFLQAAQIQSQVPPIVQPQFITMPTQSQPISSTVLLYAIGAVLLAVGGLISWLIREAASKMVPKLIETLEKRTDALTKAVEMLPEAIRSLGAKVDSVEKNIKDKIDIVESKVEEVKSDLIQSLHDKRMDQISSKLDSIDTSENIAIRKSLHSSPDIK